MGATFGRRGMEAAAPAGRRAQFIASAAASPGDEMEQRRAAFVASERARAEQAVEVGHHRVAPVVTAPIFASGKSLGIAYGLWFVLGLISAHRFYLGRPLTGIAQTGLWYVSLMFYMAGYDLAVAPLGGGLLWVAVDSYFLPGLAREINETLQARAEIKALESLAGSQA